jgi:hypothetical protein
LAECPAVFKLAGHAQLRVEVVLGDPSVDGGVVMHTCDVTRLVPLDFPGGVGNTRGNPTDFASLMNDVQGKLFDRLPDETWFYPGHGRDSTLGAERPALPEWRARGW